MSTLVNLIKARDLLNLEIRSIQGEFPQEQKGLANPRIRMLVSAKSSGDIINKDAMADVDYPLAYGRKTSETTVRDVFKELQEEGILEQMGRSGDWRVK